MEQMVEVLGRGMVGGCWVAAVPWVVATAAAGLVAAQPVEVATVAADKTAEVRGMPVGLVARAEGWVVEVGAMGAVGEVSRPSLRSHRRLWRQHAAQDRSDLPATL